MTATGKVIAGVRTVIADVVNGLLEVTHNGFALLGLVVVFAAVTLTARPDLRQIGEDELRGWLHARQVAEDGFPLEPAASDRAMAINPSELPREQAAVAYWLSKKYRVAPEPLAALVTESRAADHHSTSPESSFNPFAQSAVGAQGLMQVMTRVHTDKYEGFGGQLAAFDPVANLRVGVKVLQECIARAGSLEGGLRYYVGAANLPDDGGYVAKVLAEHFRLRQVAGERKAAKPVLSTKAPAAPEAAPAAQPAGEKVALLDGGV